MTIKNDCDYWCGYDLLSILTKADRKVCVDPKKLEQRIVEELRRELRAYAHRSNAVDIGMGFMVERRIVRDEGIDGFMELVSIPEIFDTVEAADKFFKDFLEIQYRPSMYDCTGQAFTSGYKLFQRNGQFWVNHSVIFDV